MQSLSMVGEIETVASHPAGDGLSTQDELYLEEDLRAVLEGKLPARFCFQPIADLRRGVVAGYEALLRLPTRATLPPNVCLQAAGRFGFQLELERMVAREALRYRDQLPSNCFLSVNASPLLLLSDTWAEMIDEMRDLRRVVIEITEEQSILDYQDVRARISNLQEKGGMIAIDDAGAGYASFRHILELRPAFIKLDRDFVRQCHLDRAKSALIEMMGTTASRMDSWIIAEGVETAGELGELLRLGVPLAQGYFLGRPEPRLESLLPRARHEIQTFAGRQIAEQDLRLHAEDCPAVTTAEQAEALLAKQPDLKLVMVTDTSRRPRLLLERHPLLGIRALSSLLLCQAATDVHQVLRRALTRPDAERWDPVVLLASTGYFSGVVQIDRLVQVALKLSKGD